MKLYELSRAARRDLVEIGAYIAKDNRRAANRLFDRPEQQFALLAQQPQMAAVCEDLPGEFRSFTIGNYVIYYRVAGKMIEIVRVLHGSRDVLSILGPQGNGDDAP